MKRRDILIVLVLLIGVMVGTHARFHAVPTSQPEMVQTTPGGVSCSIMSEKNPVLLTDVSGGLGTCRALLRGQYMRAVHDNTPMPAGDVITNDARFLALTASCESTKATVDIAHPLHPERPTRVALHPGDALILPPRWLVRANLPGAVEYVRLDDVYSAARRLIT